MRNLARNQKRVIFCEYLGKTDLIDENGNFTGEKVIEYSAPQTAYMRVSANKGNAGEMPFGVDLDYTRAMVTTDMKCPIKETSLLFVDKDYETDNDGRPLNDYIVKQVAPDINQTAYAIKKVSVS
jgi:hypothetical protein